MADQFGRRRSDARRYETGEANVAGRVGLAAALRAGLTLGQDVIAQQLTDIAQDIRDRLNVVPGISITEQGPDLASFITINIAGLPAAEVSARLARDGISVSVPDRPYAPLDMEARGLTSVVRIAPHLFTTTSNVDTLIQALEDIATASLRSSVQPL